jgi:hypothetical protein
MIWDRHGGSWQALRSGTNVGCHGQGVAGLFENEFRTDFGAD